MNKNNNLKNINKLEMIEGKIQILKDELEFKIERLKQEFSKKFENLKEDFQQLKNCSENYSNQKPDSNLSLKVSDNQANLRKVKQKNNEIKDTLELEDKNKNKTSALKSPKDEKVNKKIILNNPKDIQNLNIISKEFEKPDNYMNDEMKKFFLQKLFNEKQMLMNNSLNTVDYMRDNAANFSDSSDKATQEEEFTKLLKTRDRERKLIQKISESISMLETTSDYGYCEECGGEIGIKRLMARPIATFCTHCKEINEKKEHLYN